MPIYMSQFTYTNEALEALVKSRKTGAPSLASRSRSWAGR